MTQRLFDADTYRFCFTAVVTSCEETTEGRYAVCLDGTCFFPEAGGQGADRGTLAGLPVLDVQESGDEIIHTLPEPLAVGAAVNGQVDGKRRFRRMQQHTGEHILSGLAHRFFGCENVGFHLGNDEVTMDFDRPLTDADMEKLEEAANRCVWENHPVRAWYPTPDELSAMTYRSKKELTGAVRIVEIEGVDKCACCAPHVASTGEVGAVSVLSYARYKGGMRLFIACGEDAYRDFCRKRAQLRNISHLLSAEITLCDEATRALFETGAQQRRKISALQKQLLDLRIATATPQDGMIIAFTDDGDAEAARRFVNGCLPACDKLCACFTGTDGENFRFVIACRRGDLTALAANLRTNLGARCGGSPTMICGSVSATEEQLRKALLAAVL